MNPTKKPPPEARILKIREYEEKLARMGSAAKVEQQTKAAAQWQVATDEKIRQNQVKTRFEALKARREANIDVRRQRLADKLYKEDQALKNELVSSQETPEQRRAKLAARARELATRREAERQNLAQQLYDRAFTENCDVLRETNSKRVLYRTLDERNAQIEQKMATKILEEEERRMFDEMNKQEALKAEQRHLEDLRRIQEGRAETVRVLDEQMRVLEEKRQDEALLKRQEILEMKLIWEKMAKEEEEAQAIERERMRRLAAEVQEYAMLKQLEMTEAERKERELDLRVLQEALAREVEEEEREQDLRDTRRDEARKYRQHLEMMMQRAASDSADRDALIDQAYLAQQAQRDAELAARDMARRRLMAEVDAIRQQQIEDKTNTRQLHLAEEKLERMRIDEEAANFNATACEKTAKLKKAALMHHLDVQAQMVARNHMKAVENDEKHHVLAEAAQIEAAYMTKVQDVLQTTEPPKWYGRRKFDW